ncbi:MAG: ABC transporter ATP-binding protein [Pseudomonadota bacterium]
MSFVSAGGDDAPTVLALEGVTKRFGALTANDGIDLTLRRGEVLALLGENGAGKTTLMNVLFGKYTAEGGRVLVERDGALEPLEPGSPAAALGAGIAMVHQHFTLAENLSGLDNILLGTRSLWKFGWGGARRAARTRLQGIIEASGLAVPLDVRVDRLSVGERQRIEILKSLYREARVLVLDEPTALLTPQDADRLFGTLKKLTATGLSVILISHKLREVFSATDRIVVLRHGRKVGETATAAADATSLAEMMVGSAVPKTVHSARTPGEPVVVLDGVSVSAEHGTALDRVDLKVHAGEIVGVAGVSGNGQGALAALLSGLAVPAGGTAQILGKQVERVDPGGLSTAGVARIPEDRHQDGVVGTMTVAENLALENLKTPSVSSRGVLRLSAMTSQARKTIAESDIRCQGPQSTVRLMSGGNIQKLILARTLGRKPRFVLANQPTRGLDLGAAADVARRLDEAATQHRAGVLLISEDLDELLAVADRIVVLHEGRLSEAGPAAAADRNAIGLMMSGQAAA